MEITWCKCWTILASFDKLYDTVWLPLIMHATWWLYVQQSCTRKHSLSFASSLNLPGISFPRHFKFIHKVNTAIVSFYICLVTFLHHFFTLFLFDFWIKTVGHFSDQPNHASHATVAMTYGPCVWPVHVCVGSLIKHVDWYFSMWDEMLSFIYMFSMINVYDVYWLITFRFKI